MMMFGNGLQLVFDDHVSEKKTTHLKTKNATLRKAPPALAPIVGILVAFTLEKRIRTIVPNASGAGY